MRLLREDDMSLDCRLEILAENGAEAVFGVAPQCLADFGLLARYSELHGSNHPCGGSAARRQTWERGRARSSSARRSPSRPPSWIVAPTPPSHFDQFFPTALHGRGDPHRFAVLRDGPAGDVHPIV